MDDRRILLAPSTHVYIPHAPHRNGTMLLVVRTGADPVSIMPVRRVERRGAFRQIPAGTSGSKSRSDGGAAVQIRC